jgi:hypothetical protein
LHAFPAFVFLSHGFEEEINTKCFEKILELHPEIKIEHAMADFELGSRNALKQNWPLAEMAGCFSISAGLAYSKNSQPLRKAKIIGLITQFKKNPDFKKWLKAVMSCFFLFYQLSRY